MLTLTGCITINTGGKGTAAKNLGGVFKTVNKGETWTNASAIMTASGKASNFNSLNVASLSMDPNDNKALYYGSIDNGLLYTYDAGVSWTLDRALGQGTIESVAIDPKNKCNIYVTRVNKILKSIDCNRTWSQIYQDNDQAASMNRVAVDPLNSSIIYAVISRGDLIKSDDGGNAWQTVYRFEDRIAKLIINNKNSREMFVMTYKKGIYRTYDGGQNWARMVEVDNALKDNEMKYEVRDFLVIDNDGGRIIFLATYYGLLKSIDNGLTWKKLDLLAPEDRATINALAVNFSNTEEIYYTTNTTFYKSLDGGTSWKTIPLPTSRAGWRLLIDQKNPSVIYLGVVNLNK